MLNKFPAHPKLPAIVMFHAMTSYGLGNYQDCSDMLKEVLFHPPRPYVDYDICLLLARAYDKDSEKEEEEMDFVEAENNELKLANRAKNR
jgi:hypothetical protein